MDKTITGLVGAACALALAAGAEAATAPAQQAVLPRAQSYAELLDPIPNAAELLRADNLNTESGATSDEKPVQTAQYYYHHHHHHY